jgi:predicted P-loop ATPase
MTKIVKLPRKSTPPEFELLKNGRPDARNWRNARLFLDWIGVKLRFNQFTSKVEVINIIAIELDDNELVRLLDLAHRLDLRMSKDYLFDRIRAKALEDLHHPLREWFDRLEWDGTPRLHTWLSVYLGADDDDYERAVGAIFMIAAVRRIRKPGTKFDTMMILEGQQGTEKSTALKELAGEKYFTDNLNLRHDAKEIIELTSGKMIVEISELAGMRRTEVEHVKGMLSRTHDRARGAYDRIPTEVGRQFVIAGTTNTRHYLKDTTGNRRFLPIMTGRIDLKALRRDRKQLWAEAVERERNGESIVLPTRLWKDAAEEQEARMEFDPYEEALRDALSGQKGRITVRDIEQFLGKKTAAQMTHSDITRMGQAMMKLGWKRKLLRTGGGDGRAYYYVKGNEPHVPVHLPIS